MKFSDVWDEHLHVTQSKTGMKLALPLFLTCNAIGLSLAEVINICRDKVTSAYMIHHHRIDGSTLSGHQVNENTITRAFTEVRNKVLPNPKPGSTLPSFHEQRSLSDRLYREQGIDTQIHLGHKNASQTDKYQDDRGAGCKTLIV